MASICLCLNVLSFVIWWLLYQRFDGIRCYFSELLVEIIKKEASILVFSPKYGLFVETDGLSVSSKVGLFF